MIKRALVSRVERLETRLGTNGEPMRIVINFVAPDGEVVSTLTMQDGNREWWYAPGHGPEDDLCAGNGQALAPSSAGVSECHR